VQRFAWLVGAVLGVSACNKAEPDLLVRVYDAGVDAADADDGGYGQADAGDPTLGGPCVDVAQCNDDVACTFDECDPTLMRCRNIPDSSQCTGGDYCDGAQICDQKLGCEPGPVMTCDDGNECTIDSCNEAAMSCIHAPRDLDEDGDPDAHCDPGHDCNDLDPNVSSLHSEVCANGIDDNCNGLIDEMPCVSPMGTTCAAAIALSGAGYFGISTAGANETFATSCSVAMPSGARDVVVAITVPAGSNVDLEVWATTTSTPVALAIDSTCGDPTSEVACDATSGAMSARVIDRNVAAGTYYAVVTTQLESDVELQVIFLTPTPKPTNESCATAAPITPGTTTTVSIIDPATNLVSACPAQTGELTYTFTTTQTQDIRVYSSTLLGSGQPVVGLRDPGCTAPTDELSCRTGASIPVFVHSAPAGVYTLTVAGTSAIDASVLVQLAAPTPAPPDETCVSALPVLVNATMAVDLSTNTDTIKDGCFPGGPNAAFDLALTNASDVLAVGRFPQIESGAVSIDAPTCAMADVLACTPSGTPSRASLRNLPPGDYRVILNDQLGDQDSLTTLVRDAVPPTTVMGADLCANAFVIPPTGGYFTGDTTNATANYDAPCDAPSAPPNGSGDEVLVLTLTTPQRVVLDMTGSSFETILDVRQGAPCPGTPIENDCYVGFSQSRSFLDLELTAGTYYVVVHGYDGAVGTWNLDVRVVAP
jgi:Putative metal-binding motif